MAYLKVITRGIAASLLLILGACQDDVLFDEHRLPSTNSGSRHGLDDLADPNGPPRYPYPDIIRREYIPPYKEFSHMKSLTWRISWPEYAASADIGAIPTMFTLPIGALYSFNYLNSIDKENTYRTNFSLYYQDRVETAYTLWDELNIPLGEGTSMVTTYFAKTDQPLSNIEDWVKERPSLFQSYWPGSSDDKLDYEEGDIILFWNSGENYQNPYDDQYGGIRIVSMMPRIIEVYLAVPND